MEEILVINPSCSLRPGNFSIILKQLPYGAAVVNAVLKKEKFNSRLVDLDNKVRYYHDEINDHSFEQWLINGTKDNSINEYITKSIDAINISTETKFVGLSVPYKRHYNFVLALAKEIKQLYPHIVICLGGTYIPYISDFPDYVDYVVKGCGGAPILHLCSYLYKDSSLDLKHTGLSYRGEDGKFIDNGSYAEDAEDELLPDYSDLNINDYIVKIKKYGLNKLDFNNFVVASYRTHRGCTGGCSFCGVNMNEKIARKSPEKIYNELYSLSKIYPNVYLQFNDSAINNFQEDVSKVLDKIIQSCQNPLFRTRPF